MEEGALPVMDSDDEGDICRICRLGNEQEDPLFYPCRCSGSIKYVHKDCLSSWLQHSKRTHCEVCKHQYAFSPIYLPDAPALLPLRDLVTGLGRRAATAAQYVLRVAVVAYVWLMIVPLVTSLGARIALAHSIDEGSILCVLIILISVPLSGMLLHLRRGLRRLERSLMVVVVTAGHALEAARQRQWRQQQLRRLQELQLKTNRLQAYLTKAQRQRTERGDEAGWADVPQPQQQQLQQQQLQQQQQGEFAGFTPADWSRFPWQKFAGEAELLATAVPEQPAGASAAGVSEGVAGRPHRRRSARLAGGSAGPAAGGGGSGSSVGPAAASATSGGQAASGAAAGAGAGGGVAGVSAGARELSRMAREGRALQLQLDALLPAQRQLKRQLLQRMEGTGLEVLQQQLTLQKSIHSQLQQQLLQPLPLPPTEADLGQVAADAMVEVMHGGDEMMPEIGGVAVAAGAEGEQAGGGGGLMANGLPADAGMEDVLGLRGPWSTFAGTVGLVIFWNLSFTALLLALPLAIGRVAVQVSTDVIIPTLHQAHLTVTTSDAYAHASTGLALLVTAAQHQLQPLQPLLATVQLPQSVLRWLVSHHTVITAAAQGTHVGTPLLSSLLQVLGGNSSDGSHTTTATIATTAIAPQASAAQLFPPGVSSSAHLASRLLSAHAHHASAFHPSVDPNGSGSTGALSLAGRAAAAAAASLPHIASAVNATLQATASTLSQAAHELLSPGHPSLHRDWSQPPPSPSSQQPPTAPAPSAPRHSTSPYDHQMSVVWEEVASHAVLPTGRDLVALGMGYSLVVTAVLCGCAAYALVRIVRSSPETTVGRAGRRWLLRVVVRYPSLLLRPVGRWLAGMAGQGACALKVAFLMAVDVVVFPYLLGAVLAVWARPALGPAASAAPGSDPGTFEGMMSMTFTRGLMQWLAGICFELILAALKHLVGALHRSVPWFSPSKCCRCLPSLSPVAASRRCLPSLSPVAVARRCLPSLSPVRSELRVGALPALYDLQREPLPWRVMWETSLIRYLPSLVCELAVIIATSWVVVALPLRVIAATMPRVLPLRSTFRSPLSTAPADLLILAAPLLVEQLHRRRHLCRVAVRWWLRGSATLLRWTPYLLPLPKHHDHRNMHHTNRNMHHTTHSMHHTNRNMHHTNHSSSSSSNKCNRSKYSSSSSSSRKTGVLGC
ncbi:MAG: hypothetical protein WDW38_007985 [Sanguina aurantia]